jgi:protein O-mannosyl-transferase
MLELEPKTTKPLLMQGLFLCLISLAYCWISLPGLYGGFTLDDWPNLEKLDQVRDFNSLLQFILSGIASQLGRPVSLLSFALQAPNWPHNPFPFKIVGLIIHVINAWLVYLCCHLIAKLKNWPERSCFIFAGTVFGLWLFHPLNISTTFYVVQRMVLLAAFFSLIGVAAFLWGFRLSINGQSRKGLIIATLGITITYVLGILSKENAVLTGLGISVIYWLLLRPQLDSSLWGKWIVIIGIMPSLIILTYLCFHLDQHTRADFTPYQRLLTESVILLDYVGKILLPTPYKLNIFNDGFPVYKDLFASIDVIKAISIWATLLFLAFFFRKKAPFFAFAVFWFLSGHLFESSIFGLELYFEHRNYLPSLGIIIGIVGAVVELGKKAQGYSQKLQKFVNYSCISLVSALSIGYVMVYGAEVVNWKTPGALAISALTERPNSMRAHQDASAFFANIGDFKSSLHILDAIEQRWPSTGAYAQYLMLKCNENNINIPAKETILKRFKKGTFDRGTLPAISDVFTRKKLGGCTYLSWQEYLDYVEALYNNPQFGSQIDDFLILKSYSYSVQKQNLEAARTLDRLSDEASTIDYLLLKTQFYAVAGDINKAIRLIEFIKAKYSNTLKYKITNYKNVGLLEAMIKKSQLNKANNPTAEK